MTDARAIVIQAKERLRRLPYPGLKRVKSDYRDGVLILSGKVRSFHLKQLAREAVKDVARVINEIEVACPKVPASRRAS